MLMRTCAAADIVQIVLTVVFAETLITVVGIVVTADVCLSLAILLLRHVFWLLLGILRFRERSSTVRSTTSYI